MGPIDGHLERDDGSVVQRLIATPLSNATHQVVELKRAAAVERDAASGPMQRLCSVEALCPLGPSSGHRYRGKS